MTLQVFTDDSTTKRNNFVLAGYIGTAEEWALFSKEWEPLAREWGTLQPDGSYVFKMSDMMWLPERRERVAAFYRVIEGRDIRPFSFGINKNSFRRALARLSVPGQNLDALDRPFGIVFYRLISNMAKVVVERPDLFPPEDKIDFYFDETRDKGLILREWEGFVERSSDWFKKRLGPTPRFENDSEFLPLQAADFWAWWNSHWLDTGKRDFEGVFDIHKPFDSAQDFITEDDAVALLKRIIRHHAPNAVIYERASASAWGQQP